MKKFVRQLFERDRITPDTYLGELHHQSRRVMPVILAVALFTWLPYIPRDRAMFPLVEELWYLRVGLSAAAALGLLLFLIPAVRSRSAYLMVAFGLYVVPGAGLIAALTKGHPAYMGGFAITVMLLLAAPVPVYLSFAVLFSALAVFFGTALLNDVSFGGHASRYSLNDLFSASLITLVFIFITDRLRLRSYRQAKQLEVSRGSAERARDEIEKLSEFTRTINETTSLDIILEHITSYVTSNFNIDGAMLQLVDSEKNELYYYRVNFRSFHNEEQMDYVRGLRIPLGPAAGIVWSVIQKRRVMYFPRFPSFGSERGDPLALLKDRIGFTSGMIMPLYVRDELIGVMYYTNYMNRVRLTRDEIASLSRFGEQIAGAVHGSSLLRQVQQERERSDRLLLNILPGKVAEELKNRGRVDPLRYDSVSVLFTDFVGFTSLSERMPPERLVEELDGCFSQFDEVIQMHGLEKLKTIGDAYMCAGGLPLVNHTHPVDACLAALEFRDFMERIREIKNGLDLPYWELRIGIHTGPVMAGVVGKNKFAYDIWGDTVNTASRMESAGAPGRVNISRATHDIVADFFDCEHRGRINAKGKGLVDMYFVNGVKSELSVNGDGRAPNDRFREMLGDPNRF